MKLTGTIDENGVPKIWQRKELDQWFLDNKGKGFTITVERQKRKRSNPQNAFYWAVIVPMVKDAMNSYGNEYSPQDTHEFLKATFNWKEIDLGGNLLKVPRSTTALSTVDFMLYLDKIYLFGSEVLGIELPQPNQQLTFITIIDPSLPNTTIIEAA